MNGRWKDGPKGGVALAKEEVVNGSVILLKQVERERRGRRNERSGRKVKGGVVNWGNDDVVVLVQLVFVAFAAFVSDVEDGLAVAVAIQKRAQTTNEFRFLLLVEDAQPDILRNDEVKCQTEDAADFVLDGRFVVLVIARNVLQQQTNQLVQFANFVLESGVRSSE